MADIANTTVRRERLALLQQREAVKDQLIHKFRDRFKDRPRKPDEVSLSSGIISREVNRFIGSSVPMTEANLTRLERRLEQQAHGLQTGNKGIDYELGSVVSVSEYTAGSTRPSGSGRAASVSSSASAQRRMPLSARIATPIVPQRLPSGALTARLNQRPSNGGIGDGAYSGNAIPPSNGQTASKKVCFEEAANTRHGADTSLEWAVLDKLAAQLYKQDAVKQKSKEQELKQRLKQDLDKQVADVQYKQEKERQLELTLNQKEVQATKAWSEQQKLKDAERMEKVAAEKRERQAQIELLRSRKEEERNKELKEADAMLQRVSHDIERDRKLAEELTRLRLQQAKEAQLENIRALEQRKEEEKQLALRDQESVEAYEKLQMTRDERNKTASKEGQDRKNELHHMAALRVERERNTQHAMLAKTMTERMKKDQQDIEREKAHQQKLEVLKQKNQEQILEQMKEKKLKQSQELERRRQLAASQQEEARKLEAKEKEKLLAKRKQNDENRAELEQQIAARVMRTQRKEVMSDCELRLNRQLLEKVSLALTDISTPTSG